MNKYLKDWNKKDNPLQKQAQGHKALIKKIVEPSKIPLKSLSKIKRATKRSAMIGLKTSLVFLVLGLLTLGGLYAMISRGPVSMSFLVEPIEKAINREVQGVSVDIDDAVVQRVENGYGIVFRLKNVRLKNENQQIIGQAPSAAIGLSIKGLFAGRIAPKSVVFIGPEIHLTRSQDGTLGIAFGENKASSEGVQTFGTTKPSDNQQALALQTQTPQQPPKILSDTLQDMMTTLHAQQVDIVKIVYQTFKTARQSQATSAYLSSFGVRNASIVMHNPDGQQSISHIPDIEIDVDHKGNSSTLAAKASVETSSIPWSMELQAEQNQDSKQLVLKASVENLVAQSLSQYFPDVKSFDKITFPVSGQAHFILSDAGELQSAETKFQVGAGAITLYPDHPDDEKKRRYTLDEGELHLRYAKGRDKVEILPSFMKWGESRATLSGEFQTVQDQKGTRFWQFDIKASDTVIASEEFNISAVPVDKWVMNGFINPEQGRIILKQFQVETAGASVNLSGEVIDAQGSPEIYLKGQLSPMDVATFKQLWPRFAAPGARKWVGERIPKASILGGSVEIAIPAGLLAQAINEEANIPDSAVKLDISFAEGEVYFVTKLPPITAPQGRARLDGQVFTVDVPQGQIELPTGEKVLLSEGKFKIPDLRPEPPIGQISFKTSSSAQAVLKFLDLDPLGYLKEANFNPEMVSGTTEGLVAIDLPLVKEVNFSDLKIKGQVKLTGAEFPNLVEKMPIKDGSLNFDLTEKSVHANGFVMLNGIKTKVDWHRIFKAPDDKQPPIRLSATLNKDSFEKLGLPSGDMIDGDIPIIATMQKTQATADKIQIQADLTEATLNLGKLGWKKEKGKRTELEFEIAQLENAGTQLRNLRVIGDDVSIEGIVTLNPKGGLEEISFPQINIEGGTRIVVKGKKQNNTWKINVEGPSFDGRQFFRSLFSTEKKKNEQQQEEEDGDLELTAKIKDVRGYSGTNIQDVSVTMKKQNAKLTQLDVVGTIGRDKKIAAQLTTGKKLAERLRKTPENEGLFQKLNELKGARVMAAEADDAGKMFRTIGFYPSMEGGQATLIINLDVPGATEQQGFLMARNFSILGDPVVQDLLVNNNENPGIVAENRRNLGSRNIQRERIPFNFLVVPFKTGLGQFVMEDAKIDGPAMRVTLGGKVDFEREQLDLGGTYVPLPGLSDIIGIVPILGFLATNGGEGVIGVPFSVQGAMDSPQVQVNPPLPGVLREPFKFQGMDQDITPR